MGFSSGKVTKLEYASYLSAALSYLLLMQQDAVGLVTFDHRIRRYLPPRSVRSHLNVILRELGISESASDTDLPAVLHEMAERIQRRGLIILLSDLLDDPEQVLLSLKHFRHRRHEVLVFHTLDVKERDLSFARPARFVDLESEEEMIADPWLIRSAYGDQMRAFVDRYRRGCRESRIDYVEMDTTQAFDMALFAYLAKRKRLG